MIYYLWIFELNSYFENLTFNSVEDALVFIQTKRNEQFTYHDLKMRIAIVDQTGLIVQTIAGDVIYCSNTWTKKSKIHCANVATRKIVTNRKQVYFRCPVCDSFKGESIESIEPFNQTMIVGQVNSKLKSLIGQTIASKYHNTKIKLTIKYIKPNCLAMCQNERGKWFAVYYSQIKDFISVT